MLSPICNKVLHVLFSRCHFKVLILIVWKYLLLKNVICFLNSIIEV